MWSLGCILAEILSAAQESPEQAKKEKKDSYRHVLFKGASCFPLSPNPKDGHGKKFDEGDQLYTILE